MFGTQGTARTGPGGGGDTGGFGSPKRHIMLEGGAKGSGEGVQDEVTVDTVVHVEILGTPLEAKASHMINLETVLKYHNFTLAGCSGFHSKDNDFLLDWIGSHTK